MSAATAAFPAISLIIPCYNGAPFVGDAIRSALSQSLLPGEIILVDDGSTDESADVIRSFGSAVIYLKQDNRGEPAARNAGLSRAKGELIAFLDADDIWPAESLQRRFEVLERHPGALYAFGTTEQFVTEGANRPLPQHALITAPIAGATLFRRAAFERVGPFSDEHRLGAMLDWFSRATHAGAIGAPMAEIVLRRRIHETNSVHDADRLKADYLRVLRSAVRRNRAAIE